MERIVDESRVEGSIVTTKNDLFNIPDKPIIPYIEGDGIGIDITPVMMKVVDSAVEKAYGSNKKISWLEVFCGEKATEKYDDQSGLPDETIELLQKYRVSIKGPLTTPVGGGFRSLNVALRQVMDLYLCQRPVRWYKGTPSPVKRPHLVDMCIFRGKLRRYLRGYRMASQQRRGKQAHTFFTE